MRWLIAIALALLVGCGGEDTAESGDLDPQPGKGLLTVTTNAPSGAFVLLHQSPDGRLMEVDSYPPTGGCRETGCPNSWRINLENGVYVVAPLRESGFSTPLPVVIEIRVGERQEVALVYKKE